jgi:hypothetical protein
MPANTKKDRTNFHTKLDKNLLDKARTVRLLLSVQGIEKDGLNEIIEEGLELIINKYKEERNLSEDMLKDMLRL